MKQTPPPEVAETLVSLWQVHVQVHKQEIIPIDIGQDKTSKFQSSKC
jgi:hypothetical protein